jgi:hypothetical protein
MSQAKLRFMSEPAYKVLMLKHRCIGINALVSSDLSPFDVNIGTAECQVYSCVIVNYAHDVQNALKAEGELDDAKAQVARYRDTVGKSDKPVTKVKTPDDVWPHGQPDERYKALYQRITDILGKDAIAYVGDCVSLTAIATLSRDEVDIAFSRRPMQGAYHVGNETAEKSKDLKDCIDKGAAMKASVAKHAHAYLDRVIASLASDGYRPDAKEPIAYHNFFNQLAAAGTRMASTVPNPGGDDLPVKAIYNVMLVILTDQFRRGQVITERVRRIEKTDLPSAAEDGDDVDVDVQPDTLNRFQDAAVILWKPDAETGVFRKVDVTADNKDAPSLVFDAISVFNSAAKRTDLLSPDFEGFLHSVGEIGLEPRVLAWAAGHPKFSKNARAGSPDYRDGYAAICQGQEHRFKVAITGIDGFRFDPQYDGDTRIDLRTLYEGSCLAALEANLVKHMVIVGQGSSVYERKPGVVGTTYEHIYPGTAAQMQDRCNAIKARHDATGKASFGNFIVRLGSGSLSFTDRAEAEKVNKVKNDNKKVAAHEDLHPELEKLRI